MDDSALGDIRSRGPADLDPRNRPRERLSLSLWKGAEGYGSGRDEDRCAGEEEKEEEKRGSRNERWALDPVVNG